MSVEIYKSGEFVVTLTSTLKVTKAGEFVVTMTPLPSATITKAGEFVVASVSVTPVYMPPPAPRPRLPSTIAHHFRPEPVRPPQSRHWAIATAGPEPPTPTTQPPKPNRLPNLIAEHFARARFAPRPRARFSIAPPPPKIPQLPTAVRGPRDYLRRIHHHFAPVGYRGRGTRVGLTGGTNLPARASQIVTESFVTNTPAVRASQIVSESLATSKSQTLASQIVAETLYQQLSPQYVRASQVVLEVLVPYLESPPLLIYPSLIGLMPTVTKRPKWSTGTGVASSGREIRIGYWSYPQWEWDLSYDILADNNAYTGTTAADIKDLIGFFLVNYGSLQPFLFQDIDDYQVTGQEIGVGDGTTKTFLIQRTYGLGSFTGTEPVGQVNTSEPVQVYINNTLQSSTAYTVNTATPCGNTVTFASPPANGAAITMSFDFYYYCRFADDSYDFDKFMKNLWETKKVTIFSLKG